MAKGKKSGFGSRPDPSSDQVPGKTPEERAAGPVPPGQEKTAAKAGIGRLPDPTPGDRDHPDVERPDWPTFRDRPAGWKPAPGVVGGGERRDPGAPPDDLPEEPSPERGAVKTGPSTTGAGRGGGERNPEPRDVEEGEGEWKNAGQGHGGGGPGRRFGNQPDVKEGDELSGAVPPKERP